MTSTRAAERELLEGPRSRRRELRSVVRMASELVRGFRRLHFVGPCVTVFGSARVAPDSTHYELPQAGLRKQNPA